MKAIALLVCSVAVGAMAQTWEWRGHRYEVVRWDDAKDCLEWRDKQCLLPGWSGQSLFDVAAAKGGHLITLEHPEEWELLDQIWPDIVAATTTGHPGRVRTILGIAESKRDFDPTWITGRPVNLASDRWDSHLLSTIEDLETGGLDWAFHPLFVLRNDKGVPRIGQMAPGDSSSSGPNGETLTYEFYIVEWDPVDTDGDGLSDMEENAIGYSTFETVVCTNGLWSWNVAKGDALRRNGRLASGETADEWDRLRAAILATPDQCAIAGLMRFHDPDWPAGQLQECKPLQWDTGVAFEFPDSVVDPGCQGFNSGIMAFGLCSEGQKMVLRPFSTGTSELLYYVLEKRVFSDPYSADTDVDGLSDYEEHKVYHTNLFLTDTDGDGISDKLEIERGTDPLTPNANEAPGILDIETSNEAEVSIQIVTKAGARYQMERSDDLKKWQTMGTPFEGDGKVVRKSVSCNETKQAFYRLMKLE